MSDVEIEIDGRKINAKPGQMVLQVADEVGIYIPRFCYHKHLSIAANCRMCLVEVEKAPKPMPACATPVAPGMKVFTNSAKTIAAQRAVMEFLLINHPLDCPICDQGGECELQDLAMGYGSSHSEYTECKRATPDLDIGSLIATDMTRCIYCTRCVRFGDEIAGMREMGATFRGEHTEVGTYVQHAIKSEVSGNIIDLCPVGALTSKPYRFTARAWELDQAPSISPHDCVGTNINVHTRYGKVMRVVSRDNQEINETWIADRERFSYTALYHPERIESPMVKVDGEWCKVTWQHALEVAASGIHAAIASAGPAEVGALATANATIEELYLLQKLMRQMGSHNVDYRLRETDWRDADSIPTYPGFGMTMPEFEQCDAFLLIGSNLQKEQPIAALRLRKAQRRGAVVAAVNPVDYLFNFKVDAKQITAPHQMVGTLTNLVHALKQNDQKNELAALLAGKQKVAIVVGALALQHPEAAVLRSLAQQIADITKSTVSLMTTGANAAGAWLAGAIPHRDANGHATTGLSANAMLEQPRQAYILLNLDPDKDCGRPHAACAAIEKAKFVVALSMYHNPVLNAHANVILPIAAFTETSGTYVNGSGHWQSFKGSAQPFAESRPAWKVLRVLANFLHVEGFQYESSEEVRDEVRALAQPRTYQAPRFAALPVENKSIKLSRIGEYPIYDVDCVTRRSEALQQAQLAMEGDVDKVRMHPDTAKHYHLAADDHVCIQQGETRLSVAWVADVRIAKEAIWLAGGRHLTAQLDGLFDSVDMQKA